MGQEPKDWRHWIAAGTACLGLSGCGSGSDPSPQEPASTMASGPSATLSEASLAPDPTLNTASQPALAAELLTAINTARATAQQCGPTSYPAVGALRWHRQAEQAAFTQAQYLQGTNQFSHTGAQGSDVGERLSATGYQWATVGENLAAGYATVPQVVAAWLESPGHCANLMNAQFVDLGVAMVPGQASNTYSHYWGMVLARGR